MLFRSERNSLTKDGSTPFWPGLRQTLPHSLRAEKPGAAVEVIVRHGKWNGRKLLCF